MIDTTIEYARQNLDKVIAMHAEGKADLKYVLIAAQQLLRVMSPEAVEDREYFTQLGQGEACGEVGMYGRACSRRKGHVNETHRDMEYSWTAVAK